MIPLDWMINDRYTGDDQRAYLGAVPHYLDSQSTDPVWLQLKENAQDWQPIDDSHGFQFTQDDYLIYPNLPPLQPVAMATHLGERVFVYPHGFVLTLALNQSYSLARVK